MLTEAIPFCRARKPRSVFLWTVSTLTVAARLYAEAGFRKVQDRRGRPWGVDVVEQKYMLDLPERRICGTAAVDAVPAGPYDPRSPAWTKRHLEPSQVLMALADALRVRHIFAWVMFRK